jgi:hypothetical protein
MAGPTRIRQKRVRLADNLDDQRPAGPIANALTTSVTEEDLQVYFLSRLREIIFGAPSAIPSHWYDNFEGMGIFPLAALSKRKTGIGLMGVLDGVNRTFTVPLPDKFVHSNGFSICVYHNGRRLTGALSADPRLGDYYVTESAGAGTGFDTINLLSFAPVAHSNMTADYQVVFGP